MWLHLSIEIKSSLGGYQMLGEVEMEGWQQMGTRDLSWGDNNVLKLDCGDDYTTL
jgi:hypothetical protein